MSSWFSRHPDWLALQSYSLAHCSSYRELFQTVGLTLVSCGDVVVRTMPPARVPVFIVFPSTTPFALPTIIPVSALPSEPRFLEISAKRPSEIIADLQPDVVMVSERHQMSDGSLCLVGPDAELAVRPRLVDVNDAIKRAAAWFAGLRTGHFPPDTREVELFAHMPKRDDAAEILLTEVFDDASLVEGDFFLARSSRLPHTMLVGVGLIGANTGGIEQTILFKAPSAGHVDMFSDVVLDPVELAKGDPHTPGGETLTVGKWWALDAEPKPFANADELAAMMADPAGAMSRLAQALGQQIATISAEIPAAVRFPGRDGRPEWQFFRFQKPPEVDAVLLKPTIEELIARIRQYPVIALHSSRIAPDAFFLRNTGRMPHEALQGKHVVVMGLGAIGSEVADCVAKAGVGHLTLVDYDKLELGNVVRHLAGIESIGQYKWGVVGLRAIHHNPFAIIDFDGNATDFDWSAADAGAVAISSIADDNVESLISELAVQANRTVYFARALRGGKAARIFRVRPETDPCMQCLALYQSDEKSPFPRVPDDETLPVMATECNNPIRPGSAADLKLIAGLAARIVLEDVQSPTGTNHWVWVTEELDDYAKGLWGSVTPFTLPKHPHCPVCNPLSVAPVLVAEDVIALIEAECAESGDRETGGILMGFRVADDGRVAIVRATRPGPNATCEPTRFHRDVEYCQAELDASTAELGMRGRYVGEWHYHPAGPATPSGLDLLGLSQIAAQDEYAVEVPVMLLAAPGELRATAHTAERHHIEVDLTPTSLDELLLLPPA